MVGRVLRAHPSKKYAIVIDHSGAVWEHGWPTSDREWTLDTEVRVEELNHKKSPKEKPERHCPKCSALIIHGPKCPSCGFMKTTVGQPVTMADGSLVNIKPKDVANKSPSKSDGQKLWGSLLGRFAHTDGRYTQAAYVFKKQTGSWPEDAGVRPVAEFHQRKLKVRKLWPGFYRKKKSSPTAKELF